MHHDRDLELVGDGDVAGGEYDRGVAGIRGIGTVSQQELGHGLVPRQGAT